MTGAAPLVTVAIPAYNHGPYIARCVGSIIAQTHQAIELIIIDDGSSDDTPARLEALAAECRARFVRFELRLRENRGLCNTLNEALQWAEGKYFAITDSDDALLPENIATLALAIEHESDLNGIFGGGFVIDEHDAVTGVIRPRERSYRFSDILDRDKNMISSCGILRTDVMRSAGGYRNGLYIEDWYMMLKLTEGGGTLKTIPAPLVYYRQHQTNISKNIEKMAGARFQILNLFENYPGHRARLAKVHVEAAIDYWRTSRSASARHLVQAVRLDPNVLHSRPFWSAMGRLMVATPIINRLKMAKDRRRLRAIGT